MSLSLFKNQLSELFKKTSLYNKAEQQQIMALGQELLTNPEITQADPCTASTVFYSRLIDEVLPGANLENRLNELFKTQSKEFFVEQDQKASYVQAAFFCSVFPHTAPSL